LNLHDVCIEPVAREEESRFQDLLVAHHYLGAAPKAGETLWYAGAYQGEWVACISFSASALKCAARDRWIGWASMRQYDRLHLISNNSRFLILPAWHVPNLGSKVLSLCERRINSDWLLTFGHPLLLLETFVDPARFLGTVYRAANWTEVGMTKGYRRIPGGYARHEAPKKVFVKPLHPMAPEMLAHPALAPRYRKGVTKIILNAAQERSLPEFFAPITDPRRKQGQRHGLGAVLALAAGSILCGARTYQEIAEWAEALSPAARARFGCRGKGGCYRVPSASVIRDCLVRVDSSELDAALSRWNALYGEADTTLAIDGKTLKNAIDARGAQTHVMSAVGHDTGICYAQKK